MKKAKVYAPALARPGTVLEPPRRMSGKLGTFLELPLPERPPAGHRRRA